MKTLRVHKQYNQNNKSQVYITSDDDIIADDWCFSIELGEIFQCKESNEPEDHYISATDKTYHTNTDPHHCYKIIATTNTEVGYGDEVGGWYPFPTLSKSFIERLCKMDDINTITIECELLTEPMLRFVPKVDLNNALVISTINITLKQ